MHDTAAYWAAEENAIELIRKVFYIVVV